MLSNSVFTLGIVAGLGIAAMIAGLYGFVLSFRREKEPLTEWTEDNFAPPVVTHVAHKSIHTKREIRL